MWQHSQEVHQEKDVKYTMNVERVFGNDAPLRQIKESLDINKIGNNIEPEGGVGCGIPHFSGSHREIIPPDRTLYQ